MSTPRDGRLEAALADRYTIERELGRGGMATVYLAHDLKHDRSVALKVLHPQLAATLGPERFQREIHLAARLQHPHILTVYDSGEVTGRLWFTMPFVEGESLRDRLTRDKQLPVDDALRIAREAALGLEYAHQHGVIHRDIKPENILLTRDGSTLVADFGIARAIGGGGERLTETGMAVGTPAYMSPEQASGERDVDARSDVYALGAVLYEMLAGGPPFSGATAQAIIAQTLSAQPPSLALHRPGIDPAVEKAVQRALAKNPADRFPTIADFGKALPRGTGTTATATTTGSSIFSRRPLFAMLALGLLLGVGVLFAGRRARDGGKASGPKLLAVLPFENLGAPEDEYFAEGVTDEVRGKLTALSGLQVTARGSSNQYKKSPKSPKQIGQELGVQYLLTGTVRWEKGPGTASRVHVSPELVQASSGASRWQAPFDAALTDVFQVQTEIAGRVAQELRVALGDSAKRELASKPTQSAPAYDAFLRGEAAAQGMFTDSPSLRRAVAAYEQAVALDSTFVQAWAQLSRAHSTLYFYAPTPAEGEAARRAAERARTLAPNRPEGHQAVSNYYSSVLADYPRALAEDSIALALAPGNADLLVGIGIDEIFLGRWEAARAHLEQAERLDPRSPKPAQVLGVVLLYGRHYPEAQQALDRALALDPTNLGAISYRAAAALLQGDLAGARAVFRAAAREVDPTALVASVATYGDLMWALDDDQQALLLRLTPSAFDNDRGVWGMVFAQTYALRGDSARARTYADSARRALEAQLLATSGDAEHHAGPGDAQRHVLLGLGLAYLGRRAEAVREGERAVALAPLSQSPYNAYFYHQLARIHLLVGETEKALDELEALLKIPSYLSPGFLRIDPNFDPLRKNPRFQKLVAGPS